MCMCSHAHKHFENTRLRVVWVLAVPAFLLNEIHRGVWKERKIEDKMDGIRFDVYSVRC